VLRVEEQPVEARARERLDRDVARQAAPQADLLAAGFERALEGVGGEVHGWGATLSLRLRVYNLPGLDATRGTEFSVFKLVFFILGAHQVMERHDFERLRDLRGKRITADIVLRSKKDRQGVYISGPIPVELDQPVKADIYIEINTETEAKSINVRVEGVGPICRLEVDSRVHRPAGRSHKHSTKTRECPARNLPLDVQDKPDLAGKRIEDIFAEFCRMAHIDYRGSISMLD
jgi:hypothetical protein